MSRHEVEQRVSDLGIQAASFGREAEQGFWDIVQGVGNRGTTLYKGVRNNYKRIRYAEGVKRGHQVQELIAELAA